MKPIALSKNTETMAFETVAQIITVTLFLSAAIRYIIV